MKLNKSVLSFKEKNKNRVSHLEVENFQKVKRRIALFLRGELQNCIGCNNNQKRMRYIVTGLKIKMLFPSQSLPTQLQNPSASIMSIMKFLPAIENRSIIKSYSLSL
jgi:hypothetical protein